MKIQISDTRSVIRRMQIAGYRRMSAREKLRCVGEMYRFGTELALANVRRQYPDLDEWECRLYATSRWLDAKLIKKAFGWEPPEREK